MKRLLFLIFLISCQSPIEKNSQWIECFETEDKKKVCDVYITL